MNYILLSDGTRYDLVSPEIYEVPTEPEKLQLSVLFRDTSVEEMQMKFSNSDAITEYAELGTQIHTPYVGYNVVNEIAVRLNVEVNDDHEVGNIAVVTLSKKSETYVTQEDYDILCDAVAEMSEVVYG